MHKIKISELRAPRVLTAFSYNHCLFHPLGYSQVILLVSLAMDNFSCVYSPSNENVTHIVWTLDHPDDSKGIENGYWCASAALFILLFGTPLNLFVISSILWKRLYKSASVIPMLNLAFSNLLVCLLILPFIIVSGYSSEFVFGPSDYVRCIFCSIGSVNATLPMVSLYTLAIMAVGRLVYLKKPLQYSSIITPARVLTYLAIVWAIGIAIALPPYFGFGSITFAYVVSACVPLITGDTQGLPNMYYLLVLVPIGVVPILVLFVTYTWIVCISRQYILKNPKRFAILHKQSATKLSSLKKHSSSDKEIERIIHNANKQQQFRIVQVLGAIFVTNIITWIPIIALIITSAIVGSFAIPTFYYSFTYICYLLEIMLHPLLQITLIYEVKETVKKLWSSLKKTFCICFRSKGLENYSTQHTLP